MFVMGFIISDFIENKGDLAFILSKGISGMPDISPISNSNFIGYSASSKCSNVNRTVTDLKEIFVERVNSIFKENSVEIFLNRNNIKLYNI